MMAICWIVSPPVGGPRNTASIPSSSAACFIPRSHAFVYGMPINFMTNAIFRTGLLGSLIVGPGFSGRRVHPPATNSDASMTVTTARMI